MKKNKDENNPWSELAERMNKQIKQQADAEQAKLMSDFIEMARMFKMLFDSYVEVGFTENQAIDITLGLFIGMREEGEGGEEDGD